MKKENALAWAQSSLTVDSNSTTENTFEVFSNTQFGDLTVIINENGSPWFIGAEVALKLGYKNIHGAFAKHCKRKKLTRDPRLSSSEYFGQRGIVLIPESDLYRLTMKSILPEAETFQDWVCEVVLPTIRQNKNLLVPIPQSYPEALEQIAKQYRELEHQQAYIKQTKDDVEFSQAISSSKEGVLLEEFARSIGIGRITLFRWLREISILMEDKHTQYSKIHNVPYQSYIEAGYFSIKRNWFPTSHGEKRKNTTLITGKGEKWLYKKLIEAGLILSKAS